MVFAVDGFKKILREFIFEVGILTKFLREVILRLKAKTAKISSRKIFFP